MEIMNINSEAVTFGIATFDWLFEVALLEQHLHVHKFLITGAQILFYKSQTKKLTHPHFYSYCESISNNVKLWTKFDYVQIWSEGDW